MANSPFRSNNYDLGIGHIQQGYSAEYISDQIERTAYTTAPKCTICTGTPKYKLIAKHKHLDTAEIQNGVYICSHCLNSNALDANNYGIREL